MKKAFYLAVFVFVIFVGTWIFVDFYSYIFARRVTGVIEKVERVQVNVAMLQQTQNRINSEVFSFAVAIKEKTGEIVTASSEDRQWAVAQSGQCAEAMYYPYAPWHLEKAGTFFGARLLKLMECKK